MFSNYRSHHVTICRHSHCDCIHVPPRLSIALHSRSAPPANAAQSLTYFCCSPQRLMQVMYIQRFQGIVPGLMAFTAPRSLCTTLALSTAAASHALGRSTALIRRIYPGKSNRDAGYQVSGKGKAVNIRGFIQGLSTWIKEALRNHPRGISGVWHGVSRINFARDISRVACCARWDIFKGRLGYLPALLSG